MAYTPPTVDQFQERFPKFAAADTDLLELLLAEAMTQVDDSWLEQDYATAIMYLMAHLYTMESGSQSDRPGSIVSESFGPLSTSYGSNGKPSSSDYDATEYGRRFKGLRDKNFGGPSVV